MKPTVNLRYFKNRLFVDYVESVLDLYDRKKLTLRETGKLLYIFALNYEFEPDSHPMLKDVENLAFDIDEEYRTREDDLQDLEEIRKLISRYKAGDFAKTIWTMGVTYSEYIDNKPTHSYSAFISRRNGTSEVVCATKSAKTKLEGILKNVSNDQTDLRYLQNVSVFLP